MIAGSRIESGITTEPQPSGCAARRALRAVLGLAAAVLLAGPTQALAVAPDVARLVEQANAAYASGEYDKALEGYAQAEVDLPASPELAYNQGLVYYRQRDFEKARELFNTALATRDLGLEARCKFNLGNVAYSQALEKMSSLQEAIDGAKQAINHYRDTLDLNPEDEDARANIETAQLLIKDLLDKLKKEQEEQEKQKQDQQEQNEQCDNPQQQEGEQDQENQDQQQSDQQEDQNEQEQQQQEEQQQQGDEQQDQQQQEGQDQQQQQQQAEQPEEQQAAQADSREMTEEEVQRMLQAVRDKEAKRRDEKAKRVQARRARVSRDW